MQPTASSVVFRFMIAAGMNSGHCSLLRSCKRTSSHEDLKSEWRFTVRLWGAVVKVFCCGLECLLHHVLDEHPGWNWLIPLIFTFLICKMGLINGLNPIGL